MGPGQTANIYLDLKKNDLFAFGSFNCSLKFDLQEIDAHGHDFGDRLPDEYKINKRLEITIADYLNKVDCEQEEFAAKWQKLSEVEDASLDEQFIFGYNDMKEVETGISDLLQLEAFNDTSGISSNTGKFSFGYNYVTVKGDPVLVRAQVIFKDECLAKVGVRSLNKIVRDSIISKFS